MTNDKDLIDALRQNVKDKDAMIDACLDDLNKKKTTIEWIVHTLESLLAVLKRGDK